MIFKLFTLADVHECLMQLGQVTFIIFRQCPDVVQVSLSGIYLGMFDAAWTDFSCY
jgi:hypothetical protein